MKYDYTPEHDRKVSLVERFDNGLDRVEDKLENASRRTRVGLFLAGGLGILGGLAVFGLGVAANAAPGFNALSPWLIGGGIALAGTGLLTFGQAFKRPPELG